jgi:hypothetical protein
MTYTDREKIADETLAIKLLGGFDVDTGQNIELKSDDKKKARQALARLIRDKLHGFAGELLALAIDPTTPTTWPGGPDNMRPTCSIKFVNLPGGGSSLLREKYVVDFIRRRIDSQVKFDSIAAEAEKHFGLKRSRIHKIWKNYQDMLTRAASSE